MKYRMLLMLILICAIMVAAAGGTLSYYTDKTAFGFDIEPDVTPTPTPTPTPQTTISVLYQTTAAWQIGHSGKYKFNYSITITNNSSQPVEAWYIDFMLTGDTLDSVFSNAIMTKHLPNGIYEFVNPAYNNPATDNIAPGQSVTFGGQGSGHGQVAPQNAQVGGSNTALTGAVLTCQFGLQSLQAAPAPQASPSAAVIKETPSAPVVSGETPDITNTPDVTSSPEVTGTPGATNTPDVTGSPEVTSSPEVSSSPGDTGTPQ